MKSTAPLTDAQYAGSATLPAHVLLSHKLSASQMMNNVFFTDFYNAHKEVFTASNFFIFMLLLLSITVYVFCFCCFFC